MEPKYHKIQSVFKRDPANKHKTFLWGEFTRPEFEYLQDLEWEWTEKVDGTNIRIHSDPAGGKVTFGGRTERAQLQNSLWLAVDEVAQRVEKLDLRGLTLYGEGYGAGIQKGGGNYRTDQGFILFDVMVSMTGIFLSRQNVEGIAQQLDIPVVPVVGSGDLWEAIYVVKDRYDAAYSRLKDGDMLAEGLVVRPSTELRTRTNERVITKIKVRDFSENA